MIFAGVLLAVIGIAIVLLTTKDRIGTVSIIVGVLLIILGALLGTDLGSNGY